MVKKLKSWIDIINNPGVLLWRAVFIEHRLPWRLINFYEKYKNKLITIFIKHNLKTELKNKKILSNYLTVVITSAGRKEYLKKTIDSLKKNLLYPRNKIFWCIIDDFPEDKKTREYISTLDFDLKLLNKKNKGHGYSLNRIYSKIKTEFIFHCQDDWKFLKPIPINKMMNIMRREQFLGQLILNRKEEYSSKPILKKDYAEYPAWFSFNPHLTIIHLFRKHYPFPLKDTEPIWTKKMRENKYASGIFGYNEGDVYITHLGKTKKVDRL